MNANEIVKRDIEHGCILQVRQRLAERIGKAREAAKMHPHAQIAAFDVRRGNAREVRPTNFDMWDCSDNLATAVPPVASSTGVYLAQLSEIDILLEVLAHCAHIGVVLVGGRLIAPKSARAKVGHKGVSVDAVSRPDTMRDDELRLRVQRKPQHCAAPLAGVCIPQVRLPRVNVSPHLIHLHESRTDIADSGIKHSPRLICRRVHESGDGLLVQVGEPRDRADAHSLKHHRKGFRSDLRVGVMVAQLRGRFGEGNLADLAAIPLNAALSVGSRPADYVMTTFARHGLFPLAFSLGKAQNQVEGTEIGLPGFCLAPTSVDAEAGALSVTTSWWLYREFYREPAGSDSESYPSHRCSPYLKRSALATQGVSYWTQEKSFLPAFSHAPKNLLPGCKSRTPAKHLLSVPIQCLNLIG